MGHQDDCQLLELYAERGSQEAFSELVQRHLSLVYSVCLRETHNAALAEDATQAVFLILARRARSIKHGVVLAGWLFNTARLTARTTLRGERRRAIVEAKAVEEMAREMHQAEAVTWGQVEPQIQDALASLKAREREAILLRFFQEKSYKEVAAAQGIAEDNARMRVSRALEKLRSHLARVGVVVSATVLGELMLGRAANAVPATCAAKVAHVISSLASSAPASPGAGTSAYQLSRGVLRAMFVNKVKVVSVALVMLGVCAVGGKKVAHMAAADDASTTGVVPVDLSTPENTLQSFTRALSGPDLSLASQCVLGGLRANELPGFGDTNQCPDAFEVSVIEAQTKGEDCRVAVGQFKEGPKNKSRPMRGLGLQKVRLHLQDGQWKIVPASLDIVGNLKNQPDFRLQLIATFLANPRIIDDLHYDDDEMACLGKLKQIAEAARQLALKSDGIYAMDATNYKARVSPYLADQSVWQCVLDKGGNDSYVFNDGLANVGINTVSDPAHTVLFYEGQDTKLDFRHNGHACIAFVDGHVQAISQDEADKVKVTSAG